jgi:hypothetical protein
MRRMAVTAKAIALLAAGVLAWSNAGAQSMGDRELPLRRPLDTLIARTVVARVGPVTITAQEFFDSYAFGPAFVKRQADSRRRYLDLMIREKLLALGERTKGNALDPRVRTGVEAVEGDLATEELYREDVLSRVSVSGQEITDAARRRSVEVAVRWLYTSERGAADTLARRLERGAKFDRLFEAECRNVPREDRSMTVNMMDLMMRNAAMGRIVENLHAGVPSGVLIVPDGYYIVQVDSVRTNRIITATADAEARSDARQALVQHKADSLSGIYVQGMMLDANPVIQRRTFDILRAHLGAHLVNDSTFNAWGLAERFRTEGDSVAYKEIERYATDTLVTLTSGCITLDRFMAWYGVREQYLKLRLTGAQPFFLSLQDLVWRMVRDELLVLRATERKLHTHPGVAAQKRWWEDKLLYQVAKDSMAKTITWTDSTLQAYFDAHPRFRRDALGKPQTFGQAKEDVLREWYSMALTQRMVHRLQELKGAYPVAVDEKALSRVPVDAEHDPRAIEMTAAKKGGTFPRPAFPTIDPFWQTWQ